ncbi:hypothetical protein BUALT_Bualt12G0077900 [Buddleja alternifolia]|uniref:Agouti signaling protein n=1 Tax=Buddleja alternifolia TaxID=168488 RepID=A0AAV6WVP5_9LAMI|nr:hypothetical protein BUALT_Bualt12G0077900 [Buddleja alternifolia]
MKYTFSLLLIAVLLLLSHVPSPISAHESISKSSNNEIVSTPSLDQREQTEDSVANTKKLIVQIKRSRVTRVRPIGSSSSKLGEKTSPLRVYFAINFSIFIALFLL